MFVDARTLDSGTTLEADVCIAGAGAAGITLALNLVDAGLSVILLESGGFALEAETQRLYEGGMTGIFTWRLHDMRQRALGGTTAIWAGWCRPLLPQDLEERDYVAHSGWPMTYADLVPWYDAACRMLQIGAFDWDAVGRAKALKKPLLRTSAAVEHRYYQFSPPTKFGTAYRDALDAVRDVRVVLRANVTEIRLESGLGRVSAFLCRTLGGGTFHVHAGTYVLALGGIENARVLLASRAQQREGVANGHDIVGRYFMEHPHYYNSVALAVPSRLDMSFFLRNPSDLKRPDGSAVHVIGALGLAADVARRERLLNFSATLQPEAEASSETGALSRSTTQILVTRGQGTSRAVRLTVRAEQSPFAESRLTLIDEVDALGMPRASLNWQVAPEDDVQMKRGLVILAQELAAAGVARAWVPGEPSRFKWTVAPGGHHMGTTRMGSDPAKSVVDANGRTHQVRNLYIAGCSVFPTAGDSNPTLTIVALAHRLAQHLKEAA